MKRIRVTKPVGLGSGVEIRVILPGDYTLKPIAKAEYSGGESNNWTQFYIFVGADSRRYSSIPDRVLNQGLRDGSIQYIE